LFSCTPGTVAVPPDFSTSSTTGPPLPTAVLLQLAQVGTVGVMALSADSVPPKWSSAGELLGAALIVF
jgi:hypothetical protein